MGPVRSVPAGPLDISTTLGSSMLPYFLPGSPWGVILVFPVVRLRLPECPPLTRYGGNRRTPDCHAFPQFNPQHFLYFLPEPQGQGSFRPAAGGRPAFAECAGVNTFVGIVCAYWLTRAAFSISTHRGMRVAATSCISSMFAPPGLASLLTASMSVSSPAIAVLVSSSPSR